MSKIGLTLPQVGQGRAAREKMLLMQQN